MHSLIADSTKKQVGHAYLRSTAVTFASCDGKFLSLPSIVVVVKIRSFRPPNRTSNSNRPTPWRSCPKLLFYFLVLPVLLLIAQGLRTMNDLLQNILNSDISELKKEFPLFETDTAEHHQQSQQQYQQQQHQWNPTRRIGHHQDKLARQNGSSEHSLSNALAVSGGLTRDLDVIQLEPISIKSEKKNPQIVNVKQTFRFPNNFITKKNSYHSYNSHSATRRPMVPRHMYSQTSKTIVELYEAQKRENEVRSILSARSGSMDSDSDHHHHQLPSGNHRNASYTVVTSGGDKKSHHRTSMVGAKPVDMVMIKPKGHHRTNGIPTTPYFGGPKKKRPASKRKYTRAVRSRERKSRYPSSKVDSTPIVQEDSSVEQVTFEDDSLNSTTESNNPSNDSSLDDECSIYGAAQVTKIIDKLQDNIWDVSLHGIRELMEMAGQIDWKKYEKHMTIINRKMIDFLKSPRSSLCRSACQATGELFREAKSTKRPEFDEIVDILLCKTADPNRFIQKDANVALDKLVTYIPISHTVRALSARGPVHKNPLVRTATARLLVCICALSGLDAILGTNANPRTRKAILTMLAKFLTDKNLETRKFGERLYKMLRKHKFFNEYFYKDMDNNCKTNLKRILKGV